MAMKNEGGKRSIFDEDRDPETLARDLVWREKGNYERASMPLRRRLIRSRKNYLEVYDDPKTRTTNREKIFYPFTAPRVAADTSKLILDTRAIQVLPRAEDDVPAVTGWNHFLPWQIEKIGLGPTLDSVSFETTLMGTCVTKQDWLYEEGKEYVVEDATPTDNVLKKMFDGAAKAVGLKVSKLKTKVLNDRPCVEIINLLDCYIDPTADSIQSTNSFITRSYVPLSEVLEDDRYVNRDKLKGQYIDVDDAYNSTAMRRYDLLGGDENRSEVPMIEVWERWGKIPLSWITEKDSDKKHVIEAVITVAGSTGDKLTTLRIASNPYKHGKRPFTEWRFEVVKGRWYGIGVGEKLVGLQEYINTTLNERIDNALVLQHKIILYKKGSGLTPRDLIVSPGRVIPVTNPETDIRELPVTDIRQSSYLDEQNANALGDRAAFSTEAGRGQPEKGDATAHELVIREQGAADYFYKVRRSLTASLKEVVAQLLQLNMQYLDRETVIRVTGSPEDLALFDDIRGVPAEKRGMLGAHRFIKMSDVEDIRGEFDVAVEIDNSYVANKAVRVRQLMDSIELAKTDPAAFDDATRRKLYRQLFQLQGVNVELSEQETQEQLQMPGQPAATETTQRTEVSDSMLAPGLQEMAAARGSELNQPNA